MHTNETAVIRYQIVRTHPCSSYCCCYAYTRMSFLFDFVRDFLVTMCGICEVIWYNSAQK